jgi:two-component system, response regulator PdtaR
MNILIVEDNFIIAYDIKTSIERMGFNVICTVPSGEEALSIIDQVIPDLVLMDIILKGKLNGLETVAKIREKNEIPVIFISGNTDIIKQAGIKDPFLPKPIVETDLKKTINEVTHN